MSKAETALREKKKETTEPHLPLRIKYNLVLYGQSLTISAQIYRVSQNNWSPKLFE